MMETPKADGIARLVLAQAGGLDSSVAIPWLADTYRAEIVAVTIDLGQRKEWLEEVRDRALATGAVRAHVVDVRDEFARDYLARGLKAGLFRDDPTAMIETLARPIIAQTLVSIAGIEQARAVAHGDRGGSGGTALANAVRALNPALTAPGGARPRCPGRATTGAELPQARQRAARRAGLRGHRSAAGRAHRHQRRADAVAGPGRTASTSSRASTASAPRPSSRSTSHIRRSRRGRSRATRSGSGPRSLKEYLRILHDGSWFSPMRHALDAYVDRIQERVGGVVRLKLFKGDCTVVECRPSAAPAIIPIAKA